MGLENLGEQKKLLICQVARSRTLGTSTSVVYSGLGGEGLDRVTAQGGIRIGKARKERKGTDRGREHTAQCPLPRDADVRHS